jgi:hypothetical protein
VVEVVTGRYPHDLATGAFARYRASDFGQVGGIAFDAAAGCIYISEKPATSAVHRVHVVTLVDAADENTWTIAPLVNASGIAGSADGPAAIAGLSDPTGLYFDETSRVLYIADTGNHAIRAVSIALDGTPGDVSTVAGSRATLGYFGDGGLATDALLYRPEAITRCPDGDLFIADTGNNRVRRVDDDGIISTVLGDGVAASSGQGRPARIFPVDTPAGLACDAAGNLFVTSRTTVRLLPAAISPIDTVGVVDGSGDVQTIYGAVPRHTYPASVTSCLTGILAVDDATVYATDSCTGVLVELWRQPLP